MAELVVKLPQAEYQTFLKKVAKLRKAGVDVQYQVAQAKKRVVKITMLTPVEPDLFWRGNLEDLPKINNSFVNPS